jgi:hypothetical protein
MTFPAPISAELENAFKELLLSEEVKLADVLAKWVEWTSTMGGPCSLSPSAFALQLAISRHLLALVAQSVGDPARDCLEEAMRESDERFKEATVELVRPLADEGDGPIWYLARGPIAVSPEASPELWTYYFASDDAFEGVELELLDATTREVCDDEAASFLELLQSWKELVANIEAGYDDELDEYEQDLWHTRGNLEQVLLAQEGIAPRLEEILAPWDERFTKATVEVEVESDDEDDDGEGIPLLNRVPKRFEGSELSFH